MIKGRRCLLDGQPVGGLPVKHVYIKYVVSTGVWGVKADVTKDAFAWGMVAGVDVDM